MTGKASYLVAGKGIHSKPDEIRQCEVQHKQAERQIRKQEERVGSGEFPESMLHTDGERSRSPSKIEHVLQATPLAHAAAPPPPAAAAARSQSSSSRRSSLRMSTMRTVPMGRTDSSTK